MSNIFLYFIPSFLIRRTVLISHVISTQHHLLLQQSRGILGAGRRNDGAEKWPRSRVDRERFPVLLLVALPCCFRKNFLSFRASPFFWQSPENFSNYCTYGYKKGNWTLTLSITFLHNYCTLFPLWGLPSALLWNPNWTSFCVWWPSQHDLLVSSVSTFRIVISIFLFLLRSL